MIPVEDAAVSSGRKSLMVGIAAARIIVRGAETRRARCCGDRVKERAHGR